MWHFIRRYAFSFVPLASSICALLANIVCELTRIHGATDRTSYAIVHLFCFAFQLFHRFRDTNRIDFNFFFCFIRTRSQVPRAHFYSLLILCTCFSTRYVRHFLGHNSVSMYRTAFSVWPNENAIHSKAHQYSHCPKRNGNQFDAIFYTQMLLQLLHFRPHCIWSIWRKNDVWKIHPNSRWTIAHEMMKIDLRHSDWKHCIIKSTDSIPEHAVNWNLTKTTLTIPVDIFVVARRAGGRKTIYIAFGRSARWPQSTVCRCASQRWKKFNMLHFSPIRMSSSTATV